MESNEQKGEIIGKIWNTKQWKTLKEITKGEEAVAIEGATIGRNLTEGETLYSCIPIKQYEDIKNTLKNSTLTKLN